MTSSQPDRKLTLMIPFIPFFNLSDDVTWGLVYFQMYSDVFMEE